MRHSHGRGFWVVGILVIGLVLLVAGLRTCLTKQAADASGPASVDPLTEGSGGMAEQGARFFKHFQCHVCHQKRASAMGPSLVGIYGGRVRLVDGRMVTVDEDYIREAIMNPSAKLVVGYRPTMQSFRNLVSEEQIRALIAYVKSLSQAQDAAHPRK